MVGILLLTGLFIGTFYILRINKSKGLKAALLRSLILSGTGLILIGVLPGIIALFGFFFFGLGLFGVMGLINTAYGAVSDEDEIKNGTRREAAIFGIDALVTKPAQSLAGVFIAFILIVFQYQEPINGIQQPQSDLTIMGFRLAIGIIPGLIILCSTLIFKMYPLHGEYMTEIVAKLREIHREKRDKFNPTKQPTNHGLN